MFEKVPKLKKFGIFRDFFWCSSTPDFARFNLIFGWNKSGKTTFSRIFSACEKRSIDFRQYPKGKNGNLGEFEIETSDGIKFKQSNCQHFTKQIRVFNEDFIDENVSYDPSSPIAPIVYIGEEDIESNKKLKDLRESVEPLSRKYESTQEDRKKNEKAEDDFRKSTARIVKDIVGNLKINDKYRDYDKGSLKVVLESVGVDKLAVLTDSEFEKQKRIISDNLPPTQELFLNYPISISLGGKNLSSFSDIYTELSAFLKRHVSAETIIRLKNNPEINRWVQHGFELHKIKNEDKKCLFCQGDLPEGFLNSLSAHFSNDYEKLQKSIALFIENLLVLKKEQFTEKNSELYEDLQDSYKSGVKKINNIIIELNTWIDKAMNSLNEKKDNPLVTVDVPKMPKDFKKVYDEAIDKLNAIIIGHNSRVNSHEQEVKNAKKVLEKHLIAIAIKEQGYSKIKSEYESSLLAEIKAKKEKEENYKQIMNLEKETSNIGKALQKINKHLEEFFGRKEIQLELDESKKGYVIQRDDDVANNLSRGEKNAIAFSYFIVKAKEKGFEVKDGIIIIDDPISSFDSNFIYHCFSLIKNHFGDAEQLIILTHNFEFFNLIKDWYEQKNRKVESSNKKIAKESDKKPIPCEFYMIENIIDNEKRCASIVPLEETLRRFKSEYHFLFSRLNQFINEDSPDYIEFYTIGNIARRFLEIYVNFKIPTTGDLKSKVDQLDTKSVSSAEKDKVYRLIQEFSHGLDPISTIEHKDKSELQGTVKILIKMVEESDRKHFDSLKSSL